jgi:DNA polymerase-1
MQNWPSRKHREIRKQIYAPPGHLMLSVDYSQAEICALAMLCKDEKLIEYIKNRHDMHLDWAERIAKIDDAGLKKAGDMKTWRNEVKSGLVFPAFYGSQASSIAVNLHLSSNTIGIIFDSFWDEFKGVRAWQNDLEDFYRKNFYVACLNGRRRHGPMSREKLINSPVQGSASDIVVDAMNRISEHAYDLDMPWLRPLLNIHDDLTFVIPERMFDEAVETIIGEMLIPGYDWINVPLAVEAKYGRNWGDQIEIGKFYGDEFNG